MNTTRFADETPTVVRLHVRLEQNPHEVLKVDTQAPRTLAEAYVRDAPFPFKMSPGGLTIGAVEKAEILG